MNGEKMREDFRAWYGTAYPNTTWATEDWVLWQAACASKQKEIDALNELVDALLRISDRKHKDWDKVYALIAKGEVK